ncbi:LANO_0E08966g1_1 [Lachancea nothofagi CBS 11611]|uniref:LANO_0E08966g1_1 n=1 Tax=Lachancea nothofagi CBS 11611 TaxID=1266666 RepID=A0A1G4JVU0_9SACH|nr:LANO_0E08966g1_1 [Lachancea nothofagi CBS 11611]
MPIFPMKRARSTDAVGISNYKRQRLIEDLQNLRISENATTTKVISDKSINDKVWKAISGRRSMDSDVYDDIWDTFRSRNLQVIKWYDSAKLLYLSWLAWYQVQHGELGSGVIHQAPLQGQEHEDYRGYGYEPMLIDN